MAITYVDILKTKFIEPFWEIFKDEFNVFLSMDNDYEDRGSEWFNLVADTDEASETRSNGTHRDYTATLKYYKHFKPERDRDWYNQMTPVAERMKRLIGNNSNFFVLGTWVNESGTWGSTTTVWSANRDNYCWHNMKTNIDYNPERSELEDMAGKNLAIIEFPITFSISEVYA